MGNVMTMPPVCKQDAYPKCCYLDIYEPPGPYYGNFVFNYTYAATHLECYGLSNTTDISTVNLTNLSGSINMSSNLTRNITQEILDGREALIRAAAERDYNFYYIPIKISIGTASASGVCCILAVIAFIFISIYQPVISKRCSLRLSIAVAFSNFMYSICQSVDVNDEDTWKCTAASITQIWSQLLTLFFTNMIALNLLLVFVFDFSDTHLIEPFYYIGPIVLATAIILYPAINGYLGYDNGNCFFRYPMNGIDVDMYYDKLYQLQWEYYVTPMIFSILFDFVVVIMFWYTLNAKNAKKSGNTNSSGSHSQNGTTSQTSTGTATAISAAPSSNTQKSLTSGFKKKAAAEGSSKIAQHSQKLIQKAVMRIAWYPVVPLLTAFPLALSLSVKEIAAHYQVTWFVAFISNGQGVGNALIFYNDPATALARETFRKYVADMYVLRYHPLKADRTRPMEPENLPSSAWFSYNVLKFMFARDRDFFVEGKNGKGSNSTKTNSNNSNKVVKTAPVSGTNGGSTQGTAMNDSSAVASFNPAGLFNPTDSFNPSAPTPNDEQISQGNSAAISNSVYEKIPQNVPEDSEIIKVEDNGEPAHIYEVTFAEGTLDTKPAEEEREEEEDEELPNAEEIIKTMKNF